MSLTVVEATMGLYNAIQKVSVYRTEEIVNLPKEQFQEYENNIKNLKDILELVKASWASYSKEDRQVLETEVSLYKEEISEACITYKHAYKLRNRECWSKFLSKEEIQSAENILKHTILSSPKFRALVFTDVGLVIDNPNYDPNWRNYITIRKLDAQKDVMPGSYNLEDRDILFISGVKKEKTFYINVTRFVLQFLLEFEFSFREKNKKLETSSVSKRLREISAGKNLRVSFNGIVNLAGVFEGVLFSVFIARYKRSFIHVTGFPMEGALFDYLRCNLLSCIKEESLNFVLSKIQNINTPIVDFSLLVKEKVFSAKSLLSSEDADRFGRIAKVYLNDFLINRTVSKMVNIELPLDPKIYEAYSSYLPSDAIFDAEDNKLKISMMTYSPQTAGRLTQRQIQGIKGDIKGVLFNNSNYCNIDLQAAHIALRVLHLRKMINDVLAAEKKRISSEFWRQDGKMLNYDEMSLLEIRAMKKELFYAYYKLKEIIEDPKKIRKDWAKELGIPEDKVKQLMNAMGNGATEANQEIKEIMSIPGFNRKYFDNVVVPKLIAPCRTFTKYAKEYVRHIFSPCVKSLKGSGVEKYENDDNIVSMGSVSYDSDYFEKLRPSLVSNYLLMATEAYLVLSTMQDISKRKKYTRGVSVASYEYDGVLLVKDSSCTLTDDYLADFVTDRINEHARRLLHMQKRTYGDICIKAVQKSF